MTKSSLLLIAVIASLDTIRGEGVYCYEDDQFTLCATVIPEGKEHILKFRAKPFSQGPKIKFVTGDIPFAKERGGGQCWVLKRSVPAEKRKKLYGLGEIIRLSWFAPEKVKFCPGKDIITIIDTTDDNNRLVLTNVRSATWESQKKKALDPSRSNKRMQSQRAPKIPPQLLARMRAPLLSGDPFVQGSTSHERSTASSGHPHVQEGISHYDGITVSRGRPHVQGGRSHDDGITVSSGRPHVQGGRSHDDGITVSSGRPHVQGGRSHDDGITVSSGRPHVQGGRSHDDGITVSSGRPHVQGGRSHDDGITVSSGRPHVQDGISRDDSSTVPSSRPNVRESTTHGMPMGKFCNAERTSGLASFWVDLREDGGLVKATFLFANSVDFSETGSRKVYVTGLLPMSRSSLVPGRPGLSLWGVDRGSTDPALVGSVDEMLEFVGNTTGIPSLATDNIHILFDENSRNMAALFGDKDSLGTPALWLTLTDLACKIPAL